MHIYTVHKYQEYHDTEWSQAIGYVPNLDSAYLWSKDKVNARMKEWLFMTKDFHYSPQLIETQDQYNYFDNHNLAGLDMVWHEGLGKIKFPIITSSDTANMPRHVEITYFIGVEKKYNGESPYVEILRWQFRKLQELPVVELMP